MKIKNAVEPYDRKKLYSDPNYKGVRKRYAGKVVGLGDDWIFYIQYRDRSTKKVVNKKIGKLSKGVTAKKAAILVDKAIFDSLNPDKQNQSSNNTQAQSKTDFSDLLITMPIDFNKVTLFDVWEDYIYMNQDKRSVKRLHSIFNHLKPFHALNPKDITTRMIQNLRFSLEHKKNTRGTKYSPKSVKNHLQLLQTLINHGVKRELCLKNQNLHFEMPKIDNEVTEFLTEEQLAAYKKALAEDEDRIGAVFLTIILYTGMRKGAVINLKWTDVDFDNNKLLLRGEVAKSRKTNIIPLPDPVKEAILTLPHTSEYLFTGKDGKKPREDFKRIAKRVKEKAGLPKHFRSTYMLRHNFASYLASSGKVDLYTIQRLMTHESPQMTQRYAHLADKTLQEGSKVIEELFK